MKHLVVVVLLVAAFASEPSIELCIYTHENVELFCWLETPENPQAQVTVDNFFGSYKKLLTTE